MNQNRQHFQQQNQGFNNQGGNFINNGNNFVNPQQQPTEQGLNQNNFMLNQNQNLEGYPFNQNRQLFMSRDSNIRNSHQQQNNQYSQRQNQQQFTQQQIEMQHQQNYDNGQLTSQNIQSNFRVSNANESSQSQYQDMEAQNLDPKHVDQKWQITNIFQNLLEDIIDQTSEFQILYEISNKMMSVHRHPLEILCGLQDVKDKLVQDIFEINKNQMRKFLHEFSLDPYQKYSIHIEQEAEDQDVIKFRKVFFNRERQSFNFLKMCKVIATRTIKIDYSAQSQLLKYAILQILQYTGQNVSMFFATYAKSTLIQQSDLNSFKSEKVWDFNSLQQFIENFIDTVNINVHLIWIQLRNEDISAEFQDGNNLTDSDGYLSFGRFKDFLKTHKPAFKFTKCDCSEINPEDNTILHQFYPLNQDQNQQENPPCMQKLLNRCDQRLKVPSLIQQFQNLSFFYQLKSQLNQVIGVGFPLFFDFMVYCIIIIGFLFVTSGTYNLLSNMTLGDDCLEKPQNSLGCQLNWITQLSLENKRFNYDLNQLQNSMTVFSIIAVAIIFQFQRRSQRKIIFTQDKQVKSRQDYTIVIERIQYKETPQQSISYLQNKIQDYIEQEIYKEYQIQSLNKPHQKILGDEDIFIVPVDKEKGVYWAFVTLQYEEQKAIFLHSKLPFYVPNSLTNQTVQLQQFNELSGQYEFKHFYLKDKQQFLLPKHRKDQNYTEFSKARVRDSYEPEEYLWENITNQAKVRRFLSWTIFIIALGLSVIAIYYVNLWQVTTQEKYYQYQKQQNQVENTIIINDLDQNQNINYLQHQDHINMQNNTNQDQQQQKIQLNSFELKFQSFILFFASQSVAWSIQAINFFLNSVMMLATKLERRTKKTGLKTTLAKKLTLLRFLTSTLTLFLINVIFVWINQDLQQARVNIHKNGGLVYNINMLMINTALKDPIVYLFGNLVGVIINSLRIKYRLFNLSQILALFKGENMNSALLNQNDIIAIENLYLTNSPEYPIEQRYAWLVNTMLLSVFYAPLIPVGFIWAIIGILFMCYIEKFLVLYTIQVTFPLQKQLSLAMTEMLEYCLILYCFSNFIFEYIVVHGTIVLDDGQKIQFGANATSGFQNVLMDIVTNTPISIWVGLTIGFVNALLPMQQFNEILFPLSISGLSQKELSYKEEQISMGGLQKYYEKYRNYLSKLEIYKEGNLKTKNLNGDADYERYHSIEWPPEFYLKLQDNEKQGLLIQQKIDPKQQLSIKQNNLSLQQKAKIANQSFILAHKLGQIYFYFYDMTFKHHSYQDSQQKNPAYIQYELIQRQLYQEYNLSRDGPRKILTSNNAIQ